MINPESTYILYRSPAFDEALRGVTAAWLSNAVFWNAWRTRQAPYAVLTRGDTLYLLRRGDRHLIAELRVAQVTRTRFHSRRDASRQLGRAFGVDPEEAYWPSRQAEEGWLLAYNCDVVKELDVATPTSFQDLGRMGRNGFIAWPRIPAAARRSLSKALPDPGGRPLALAPCPEQEALHRKRDRGHQRSRYIPEAVARAVWARDGLRCRECGKTQRPFHLDHKRPFSKGGRTTVQNLRVLCQSCNLEKGAWDPSQRT